MEHTLSDIVKAVKDGDVDRKTFDRILRTNNARRHARGMPPVSKRTLMSYVRKIDTGDADGTALDGIDEATRNRLMTLLRVKPRRTASGVATITVITKPWPCSGDCLYCPNDMRMPKSYLADEPACQRAERNRFDPYLQAASRLQTLQRMGHITDKVELIVLGGSWNDYPQAYRTWFICELFRALNDGGDADRMRERRRFYRDAGIGDSTRDRIDATAAVQARVDAGEVDYRTAWAELYGENPAWTSVARRQTAQMSDLERAQKANEGSDHRCVGLVIETRPDGIDVESLTSIRRLGCTKVQMGIQSLNPAVLKRCDRHCDVEQAARAFELVRLFGFKIHAHFMANLPGAAPDDDVRDYRRFVDDAAFRPDEVKIYPCSLIRSARLTDLYDSGAWTPYTEDELVDVLAADMVATPRFTRVSRMIRDFSSHDIVAGNRKVNLRQSVDAHLAATKRAAVEIRSREIATGDIDADDLTLRATDYVTSATREWFLEWTTPDDRIAGFLRLSFPDPGALSRYHDIPITPDRAMIREVHVYGRVAALHTGGTSQHLGLGKRLIAEAEARARDAGYGKLAVISAVGTRDYYRGLGFEDAGLYQEKPL